MPKGVSLISFADYVAITVVARTAELIEQVANPALKLIAEWMGGFLYGLKLGPEKTAVIMLTKKRAYRLRAIKVCGHDIDIKRSLTYLGVRLDTRLSFRGHTVKTAESAVTALGWLVSNLGGPS